MSAISSVKKQNKIKISNKRKKIKRNKNIFIITIILTTLLIIGSLIKNMYVYYRCFNFVYSIDYYFTHWKDKSLRLIEVESLSVMSNDNNIIEIKAYGYAYKKPYKKTYLVGRFTEDDKGHWYMKSVKKI